VSYLQFQKKTYTFLVSDIAIFVLKRDVKLQLTNLYLSKMQMSYSCLSAERDLWITEYQIRQFS